ncbi:MAG TPA: chemotaxis protein CheB, partial [Polyangiaceae bacterium]|nr:chemotaxis protein CheB [Polyangiaceae bacterium]
MGTLKLLIVDDSALMRRHLVQIFEEAGGFEIRTARDGLDCLRQTQEFQPDVVTLDLNMPHMDGMTCLSHLMIESPRPVVVVSSLTERDALPTLEALALGAVDYVPKPGGTISANIRDIHQVLVSKVRGAARSRVRRARNLAARLQQPAPTRGRSPATPIAREPLPRAALPRAVACSESLRLERLVLIGVSTGGPRALEELLPKLPADYPIPILVSVHMPGAFTTQFAKRMGEACALQVVEVRRQVSVAAGTIYLAAGDTDMLVTRRSDKLVAIPTPADPSFLWHPSIERMVASTLQ